MFLNALAWVVILWAVFIGGMRTYAFVYWHSTDQRQFVYEFYEKECFTTPVLISIVLGVVAALWLVFGA